MRRPSTTCDITSNASCRGRGSARGEVNLPRLGRRWISAVYTPTFDAAGAPDGWVAVVIDVDDRKRAEEALKAADHRKDDFLATLAHELRNPLAPIRNAVQIRRMKGPLTREMQAARDMIDRQVQQMVHLIDDLLDVSRISRSKVQLRKERIALAAVLESAVETSRPLIEASAHELTMSVPPTLIHVDADPIRLAQVFSNLLNNAAKYTERNGHIRVTAERHDGEVVVGRPASMTTSSSRSIRPPFRRFSFQSRRSAVVRPAKRIRAPRRSDLTAPFGAVQRAGTAGATSPERSSRAWNRGSESNSSHSGSTGRYTRWTSRISSSRFGSPAGVPL